MVLIQPRQKKYFTYNLTFILQVCTNKILFNHHNLDHSELLQYVQESNTKSWSWWRSPESRFYRIFQTKKIHDEKLYIDNENGRSQTGIFTHPEFRQWYCPFSTSKRKITDSREGDSLWFPQVINIQQTVEKLSFFKLLNG